MTRRAAAVAQISELRPQADALKSEEDKLALSAQRLQSKVEAFRTRKETIKATYTAAEAQSHVSEAVSGISEEMGDVGMAMQRAEDKTAQMQARAGALDELMASGVLDDASSRPASATTSRPRWTPPPAGAPTSTGSSHSSRTISGTPRHATNSSPARMMQCGRFPPRREGKATST